MGLLILALYIWVALSSTKGQSIVTGDTYPLIYVSTLDGTFYAVDAVTGHVKWRIQEEKIVNIPKDFQKNQKFFPDPLDGSLYVVNRGSVEKLPHTIPEMVHNSPMRTRNGLLYAGKKTDYWLALDPDSGDKHASVTTDGVETCTAVTQNDNNLFVGKTEYSLTIVDSKISAQTWNVTYVLYAAPALTDITYGYTHYTSSSDGTLVTFNTAANKILWHTRLTSPIISIFVERFGSLLRVPFRTLAADTLTSYILQDIRDLISDRQKDVVNCLFIGKYAGGVYAMNEIMHTHAMNAQRPIYPQISYSQEEDIAMGNVMTIGRHVLPVLPEHLLISHIADDIPRDATNKATTSTTTDDPMTTYLLIAVVVICVLILTVFIAMCVMYSMISNLKESTTDEPAIVPSKHMYSVGKINVNLGHIIGHGSEGTVVFRGMFEKRQVAVKRVLLDFIDIDLHEVELLRQADEHPNVIRYFCMETDNMFRYIALELCAASLRDYVENTIFVKSPGQNKNLLYETISGIKHLHSLNIVHRDIKPGNILITKCTKKSTTLKALISDFGLCRKISEGRQSLTARTGSAGTDGWIAPEMLSSSTKISCAVDIFSYGCIMYYVLSGGNHPFGDDVYRRQANIINYDYDLSLLSESTQDNMLAVSLICKMVGRQQVDRPTAAAIYVNPYFWNPAKQLRFYSDVSDRVEKEETSELVLRWEHNCIGTVLRGGWMLQCPELEEDLYKYRKYKTGSVRDLLRAMRNKRHHYRELPEALKTTLGDIPDGYMNYFTSRFPKLLLHTYTIMEECSMECVFRSYYPEVSTFREERLEMSRYIPDITATKPTHVDRVALNKTGEYSTEEIIVRPPQKTPVNKEKKGGKNPVRNKAIQRTADEVLSWRRNPRTHSESSDTGPKRTSECSDGRSKRTSGFCALSDNPPEYPTKSPEPPEFQIKTRNKFGVLDSGPVDNDNAGRAPWFQPALSKHNNTINNES